MFVGQKSNSNSGGKHNKSNSITNINANKQLMYPMTG